MAKSRYVRLDLDWREDPKTMLFEELHGKAALADWVSVMCLMAEAGGGFSMAERGMSLRVRKALGMTEARCMKLFDSLAECGLITFSAWKSMRLVTSCRAQEDAERAAKRRTYAANASAAAAAKRREEGGGDPGGDRDGTP